MKSKKLQLKNESLEKDNTGESEKRKEGHHLYKEELATSAKFTASAKSSIKRGDISWAYFPIAYGIILTIIVGIIQLLEIMSWYWRILLIVALGVLFFYLCFFNDFFRNKIVWLFSKSKEHKEEI